jgi:hypothetical protein
MEKETERNIAWVHDELSGLDLNDKRLNTRLITLVSLLSAHPRESIGNPPIFNCH